MTVEGTGFELPVPGLGRAFFTPLRSLEPQRARELVLPYRNPVLTDSTSLGGCRFGAGLGCWLRFRPDPHRPALCLINIEGSGLSDQIAQFSIAIRARVEVGGDVREAMPYRAQADPAIFRLHLHNGLV